MFLSNAVRNSLFLAKERHSGKTWHLPSAFLLSAQQSWSKDYKAPKTQKEIDAEWGPPNEPNL